MTYHSREGTGGTNNTNEGSDPAIFNAAINSVTSFTCVWQVKMASVKRPLESLLRGAVSSLFCFCEWLLVDEEAEAQHTPLGAEEEGL